MWNIEWIESIKKDIINFYYRNTEIKSATEIYNYPQYRIGFKEIILGLLLEVYFTIKKLFYFDKVLIVDAIFSKRKNFYDLDFRKSNWFLHKKTINNLIYKYFLNLHRRKYPFTLSINEFKSKKNFQNIDQDIFLLDYLWKKYAPTSLSNNLENTIKLSKKIFPNSRNIKTIVTATSFYKDEYFNIYSCLHLLNSETKYIIIQHGGGYGFSRFNDEEEYQLIIADEFWSWGWKNSFAKCPKDYKFAKIIK